MAECGFFYEKGYVDTPPVLNQTLDLINRQKANAEGLMNAVKFLNEQLSLAKAEAVKEFAERLKDFDVDTHYSYASIVYELSEEDIDNLVKEMVGETNAE